MKKDETVYIDDSEDISWIEEAVAKRNKALRRTSLAKATKAAASSKDKTVKKPVKARA